jgi:hypothetical protein
MILKAVADSFPVKTMSSSNPWGSPAWHSVAPFQVSGRMARCMARVSTSTVMAWIHCCPLRVGPGGCEDWLSDSYTGIRWSQFIHIYPISYPIPPCLHQHWSLSHWSPGTRYQGEFKENLREGYGVLTVHPGTSSCVLVLEMTNDLTKICPRALLLRLDPTWLLNSYM